MNESDTPQLTNTADTIQREFEEWTQMVHNNQRLNLDRDVFNTTIGPDGSLVVIAQMDKEELRTEFSLDEDKKGMTLSVQHISLDIDTPAVTDEDIHCSHETEEAFEKCIDAMNQRVTTLFEAVAASQPILALRLLKYNNNPWAVNLDDDTLDLKYARQFVGYVVRGNLHNWPKNADKVREVFLAWAKIKHPTLKWNYWRAHAINKDIVQQQALCEDVIKEIECLFRRYLFNVTTQAFVYAIEVTQPTINRRKLKGKFRKHEKEDICGNWILDLYLDDELVGSIQMLFPYGTIESIKYPEFFDDVAEALSVYQQRKVDPANIVELGKILNHLVLTHT